MTTQEIIEQIARENDENPQEVKNRMQEAIRAAMMSSDPGAQLLWKQLSPDGKEPSIDEFIAFCIEQIVIRDKFKEAV